MIDSIDLYFNIDKFSYAQTANNRLLQVADTQIFTIQICKLLINIILFIFI